MISTMDWQVPVPEKKGDGFFEETVIYGFLDAGTYVVWCAVYIRIPVRG